MKWIPFYEVKITPLRLICAESLWDKKISPQMWTKECKDAWKFVIESITDDTALVRWDSRKKYFIQTDYSALGMGFVGMQPANDAVLLAVILRKMDGGLCKFIKDPPTNNSTKLIS